MRAVITVLGCDRVGIIAAVTAILAETNTNILDKPQWTALATDASATQVLRESLYSYDGGTGSLTQQRDRICESSYRTNSFGYDLYGNQTSHTSPVGIVTSFGFDTVYHALPVLQTVAGSFATTFSHDPLSGQLVISVDPKGLVVSNSLDVFLRLTGTYVSSTSNGPPNVWQTLRDYGLGGISAGVSKNYLRVRANDGVDGNNGLETWTYLDGQDRAIQQRMESESNGYRVTDTSYEKRGLVRFVTLPYFSGGTVANTNYAAPTGNKAGTSMEYDPLGRRTKVAPGQTGNFNSGVLTNVTIGSGDTGSPLGPSLTDYQDGNDPWSLVVTDPENKVRKYRRDAYGRTNQILEVTGSGTYTSTLKWDKTGVLTNLTDHAQNVIEYAYNDLGEVVAMADPDLGVWQYRRDFAGRLREQVDAKGNLTSLIYNDPIGRLSHKLVYDPNGVLVLGVTNIFDTGEPGYTVYPGQTFAKFDNEGWEKHSYDVRGRELKSTRYLAATAASYTIERSFDDGDHVRSLSYPSSLLTLTNGYDSGGHLSDVTRCDGVTNTHYLHFRGFTELNQPVGADFGNGVTTTNDYWPVSRRLRSLTTYIGGRHLQALSYQYNRSDDVISISDGAYSGTGSGALSATYDDLHRLSSVARATNTASFSYSAIGNVLGNGEWAGAGYDYGSRLPHAVKRVGSQYYAYDMNGNTVARGPQNLAYDAANRLVLVRRNGAALASFGYAADGARLWKQGVTNLQVWIGNVYEEKQGKRLCHIWAGDRRVATFDSAGTLLSGTNNTTLYYSHGDHLGSSSVLTDHAGNRAEHFEYSAFGRERYDDPANAFPISQRFTGQVLDDETGLYYYGARYYDPAAARFAQPDTVIPDIANPQSWNRYSYCINNPLGRTDPSGHWDWPAPAYNWMPNSWVRYLGGGGSGPATPAAPEALSNLGMLQSDLGGYDGSGVRTFTTMAKVGVGLTPAGVYNSGYTLGTGKDAYDSEVTVSRGERLQAGAETAAAILPFVAKVGTSLRAAGTAAEDTGTFSRLAQPGGLMVSEKAGGHLLARHVGLSEADLAARLSSQRGITAASSFTTRAEAEAAVAGAFDANAVAVSAWTSSGANGRFVLNAPFSGGLVLQRGAAAASPGTGVRVVLQGNGSGGYHTLTGFPTP